MKRQMRSNVLHLVSQTLLTIVSDIKAASRTIEMVPSASFNQRADLKRAKLSLDLLDFRIYIIKRI